MKSVSCEEKHYFFCSTPKNPNFVCPEDHFSYKGKCLFKSNVSNSLSEAKHSCAQRGGIVLPLKTKGMYLLIKKYLIQENSGSIFIGLNMTAGENMFTDKSLYTPQSYDYDGESSKLVGHPCAYLKKGIWFLPRGTPCEIQFEFICLWTRKFINLLDIHNFVINYLIHISVLAPNCPSGFKLYPHEKDGRTCYSKSDGI